MKKTVIDEYLEKVYVIVIFVITGSCLLASTSVAALKTMGHYETVPWMPVILLIATTVSYFIIGIVMVIKAFKKIDGKRVFQKKWILPGKIFVVILLTIQWNFLSFLMPSRNFWAFIFYFLMLVSLFLDFKMSCITAALLAVSTAISWVTQPENHLPVQDELFVPDMGLRIMGMGLGCGAILLMTYLAGHYLVNAKKEEVEKSNNRVQNMLNEITVMCGDLGTASDILANVSQSESASSEEISATSASLYQNSNTILAQARTSHSNLEQLNDNRNALNEKMNVVNDFSQKLLEETSDNEQSLNELVEFNTAVMDSTAKTRDVSVKLADDIDRVLTLLGSINDIAFSTNILAINASIEAAHAGEAGKSFSIVANEVGNLANRSRSAVNDIENVIKEVNQSINSMTEIVSDNSEKLSRQNDSIKSTYNGVQDMISMLKQSLAAIEEINSFFEIQKELIENTYSMNEQISAAIEQENHEFGGINEMISGSTANAEEMANQVKNLKEMIDKMNIMLTAE